jgi:hypothetical protein
MDIVAPRRLISLYFVPFISSVVQLADGASELSSGDKSAKAKGPEPSKTIGDGPLSLSPRTVRQRQHTYYVVVFISLSAFVGLSQQILVHRHRSFWSTLMSQGYTGYMVDGRGRKDKQKKSLELLPVRLPPHTTARESTEQQQAVVDI